MKQLHDTLVAKYDWYARWHQHPLRHHVHWGSLAVVVLVVGSIFYGIAQKLPVESGIHYAEAKNTDKQVVKLTKDLLNAQDEHKHGPKAKTEGSRKKLVDTATERRQALSSLIVSDPKAALESAISESQQADLAPEVAALTEKTVDIEGTTEVLEMDFFSENRSETEVSVTDAVSKKRYKLYFPKMDDAMKVAGKKIKVKGIELDGNVAVADHQVTGTTSSKALLAVGDAPIVKKAAIILINFYDDPRQPVTPQNVKASVFSPTGTSVRAFYKENSFNQWDIQGSIDPQGGDVFGWYTIPYSAASTGCVVNNIYNNVWRSAALAQAAQEGFVESNYDRISIVFPAISQCAFSGVASLGGTTSYMNGFNSFVVAHEWGHTAGLDHASKYICADASGVKVPYSNSCTVLEYGDIGIMGGGNYHMNARQKGQYTSAASPNWLSPANKATVTSNGTFTLYPIEQATTGLQSIAVPGPNGQQYFLEYRRPIGFDAPLQTVPVINGVLIRLAPSYNYSSHTYLIDTNPQTTDFYDSALAVGKVYQDAGAGVTITTLSATSTAATVKVTFSPSTCTRATPTISVVAPSQSAESGQTVSYEVSVTNRDSATCDPTTYNFTSTLPTGWTQTPAILDATINPGETVTKTVLVTSPTNVPVGTTTLTMRAVPVGSSTVSISVPVSYVVIPSALPTPTPTATPGPDTVAPVVTSFDVQPRNLSGPSTAEAALATFTTTDTGGAHLHFSFLKQALYDATGCNDTIKTTCNWVTVGTYLFPPTTDSATGAVGFNVVPGTFYYSLEVRDHASNVKIHTDYIKVTKAGGSQTPAPLPTATPTTTPTPVISEAIPPVVAGFDVQPRNLSGPSGVDQYVIVSANLTDAGGSHLNTFTLDFAGYNANGCNDTDKSNCSWSMQLSYPSSFFAPLAVDSYVVLNSALVTMPGTYYFRARATDKSNNIGDQSAYIKVTKTLASATPTPAAEVIAPIVTSFDVQPRNLVASSVVTVTSTFSDAGGSHLGYVAIERAPAAGGGCSDTDKTTCNWSTGQMFILGLLSTDSYSLNVSTSIPALGVYYFRIRVVDAAGNVGYSTNSVKITRANVTPVLTPPPTYTATPVPTPDTVAPSISIFNALPSQFSGAEDSELVTTSWLVNDVGGSYINHVELYQASAGINCTDTVKTGCVWHLVVSLPVPAGTSSWASSQRTFVNVGITYFGLQAVDNAGNRGYEPAVGRVLKIGVTPSYAPIPTSTPTPTPTPVDTVSPVVAVYDVQPRNLSSAAATEFIAHSWTVTDAGGSHLDSVEIYRASYNQNGCNDTVKTACSWALVGSKFDLSGYNLDTFSGAYSDTVAAGIYYFGLQVIDAAGHRGYEPAIIKVTKNASSPTPTSTVISTPTPTPIPTPASDVTHPVVNLYDVQPRTLQGSASTENISASWTVSDVGGSHLKFVEVYRATYNAEGCNDTNKTACNWTMLQQFSLVGYNLDNWSGLYNHSISAGTFYYGLQAVDGLDNRGYEPAILKVVKTSASTPTPTPTSDVVPPVVSSFDVQPRNLSGANITESAVASFTVSDGGGSHLNLVQIWQAAYNVNGCNDSVKTACSWTYTGGNDISNLHVDSYTGTYGMTVVPGTFYYGLRVADAVSNWGYQSDYVKITKILPNPTTTPLINPTPIPNPAIPVIAAFNVQPANLSGSAENESVTASWTVNGNGSSFLSRVELYQASEGTNCTDTVKTGCAWAMIKSKNAPGSANSWTSNTTDSVSVGTYYYGLQVIDKAGNRGYENAPIRVVKLDVTIPTVSITGPSGSTVARDKTVNVTANASDINDIARVEFSINGTLRCTDTAAPYACPWLVPPQLGEVYVLSVRAYDTSDNNASATKSVTSK